MSEYLYRCEGMTTSTGHFDSDGDCIARGPTHYHISTHKYIVSKWTTCGAWITVWDKKRFVNLNRRKKFACKTKDDAIKQFKHRKVAQIRILTNQLKAAKNLLRMADYGISEDGLEEIFFI